ncbi:MAG: nuclear transport factor 2 family protein [Xenococcus sp. (in: cyanobacteria)]
MLELEKIQKLIADYYIASSSMDGTKWAAKFAEEATIEDPVGTLPITGGREVFCQFYTNAVNANFQTLDIKEQNVFIKPNQAAVSWNFEGLTHQGVKITFEGMTLFVFNDSCLIISFKAYWNPTQIMPLLTDSKSVDSLNK